MEKNEKRKANCIYCTSNNYCMNSKQLGSDCEGKCGLEIKGKYEPIKESNHGKE